MSFGNILRSLIEERGITQKELAKSIHIAPSTLGCYVQNIREPDFSTLKQISQFFDVSIDFLLENQSKAVNSSAEENLLRVFRSLTPEQQELYLEQGRAFLRVRSQQKGKP